MAQAGYPLKSPTLFGRLIESVRPPWRGALPVIAGMSWARAAIFYGSDLGYAMLKRQGAPAVVCTALPALSISTFVQFVSASRISRTETWRKSPIHIPTFPS